MNHFFYEETPCYIRQMSYKFVILFTQRIFHIQIHFVTKSFLFNRFKLLICFGDSLVRYFPDKKDRLYRIVNNSELRTFLTLRSFRSIFRPPFFLRNTWCRTEFFEDASGLFSFVWNDNESISFIARGILWPLPALDSTSLCSRLVQWLLTGCWPSCTLSKTQSSPTLPKIGH